MPPPTRLAPHLSQLCQGPAWHLGHPGRRSGRSGRPGPQDGCETPTSAGAAAAWGAEMGQVRQGLWAGGGKQVGGAGSGRLTSAWPAGPRPGMSQQWSRPRCPPRSRALAPGQTSLGPARAAGTGCQRPAHLWGQREKGSTSHQQWGPRAPQPGRCPACPGRRCSLGVSQSLRVSTTKGLWLELRGGAPAGVHTPGRARPPPLLLANASPHSPSL